MTLLVQPRFRFLAGGCDGYSITSQYPSLRIGYASAFSSSPIRIGIPPWMREAYSSSVTSRVALLLFVFSMLFLIFFASSEVAHAGSHNSGSFSQMIFCCDVKLNITFINFPSFLPPWETKVYLYIINYTPLQNLCQLDAAQLHFFNYLLQESILSILHYQNTFHIWLKSSIMVL